MKVSLKICFCAGLFLVSAQLSEAQDLMAQVAEDLSTRIANAGDRRIIVDAKLRCDSKKCAAFAVQVPELIKNALMRSSAPPEIVSQAELERLLRQQGFQPIDYYFSGALRPISRQIKAFFLTGSMKLKEDRSEVNFELHDGRSRKRVYRKKITVRLATDPSAEESSICDSSANVCLASRGSIGTPTCEWCPNPDFTREAVDRLVQGEILLLVTVTRDGTASDLAFLQRLGHGLDEKAVEQVRAWRFKPARDATGSPVATRVVIEVKFRQF